MLNAKPNDTLGWLLVQWQTRYKTGFWGYNRDLGTNPPFVATRLRELAEDPEALAGLVQLAEVK